MQKIFYVLMVIIVAVSGCTAASKKYVDLYYSGISTDTRSGKVGISTFTDNRPDVVAGYIGTRYLGKSGKETYFAFGDDLAVSVTGICKAYLQDTGFECTSIPRWNYSPEGVMDAGQRFDFIVGGEIRKLECFAVRKIGFTSMTLDIELVIYVGNPDRGELKTTPVKLNLERNEIIFSKKKLQQFLNESLLEVIRNALSFDNTDHSQS